MFWAANGNPLELVSRGLQFNRPQRRLDRFAVALWPGDRDPALTNEYSPEGIAYLDNVNIEVLPPLTLPGDVNLDGIVNGLDVDPFVALVTGGTYQPEADINLDAVVNGLDVDPFVAAVVGGVQQIPEPSTLLLALLALCVVGGWRKWGG
jgi:hypothetical protein